MQFGSGAASDECGYRSCFVPEDLELADPVRYAIGEHTPELEIPSEYVRVLGVGELDVTSSSVQAHIGIYGAKGNIDPLSISLQILTHCLLIVHISEQGTGPGSVGGRALECHSGG